MENQTKGEANDGTFFTLLSAEVQMRLQLFPEITLEKAIADVVDLHNYNNSMKAFAVHVITSDDITKYPQLTGLGFQEGHIILVHKNETLINAIERFAKVS